MKVRIVLMAGLLALVACERSHVTPKPDLEPASTPAKTGAVPAKTSETPAKANEVSAMAGVSPALRMVREHRMGVNLGMIALGVAQRSQTSMAMVAEKYGAEKVNEVMTKEIARLLPEYIEQWDEKLADAYSHHLTEDELISIAKEGKESPHVNKLMTAQSAVGEEMQKTALPIVQALVVQAFSNVIKRES